MTELVSVITVTYNAAATLEETIKSVIAQDYARIEYLIVDGGSTDGTHQIIERYRDNIDVFLTEPDEGIYDAVNKGICLSSGRVIKIQNADDLLLPGAVSTAMEQLCLYGLDEPVILIGCSRVIDAEGRPKGRITNRPVIFGFDSFNHPGWFATAKVYEEYGLYDLRYHISSDYEFYLRYKFGGGRIVWIDKDVACYRQDGASSGLAGVREVARINRTYYGRSREMMVRVQHQVGKQLRPLWRLLRGLMRTWRGDRRC